VEEALGIEKSPVARRRQRLRNEARANAPAKVKGELKVIRADGSIEIHNADEGAAKATIVAGRKRVSKPRYSYSLSE
jgi:hypothetical protein